MKTKIFNKEEKNKLLKSKNFLNNQNYITSDYNNRKIKRFYFSLIKKDDSFQLKLIFFAIWSPMIFLFIFAVLNIHLSIGIQLIFIVVIPIILTLFLPFKGLNLIYYYLYRKNLYIKYIWFYDIKRLHFFYTKRILWKTFSWIDPRIEEQMKKDFIVIKK